MTNAVRPRVAITGASAGVGRATATAFGRRGWAVALIARGRRGLDGARKEVESVGGQAMVVPADVADGEAVRHVADEVAAAWDGIDVWVNNAMVTIFAPVEEITSAEFRRVTEVTYLGQVHGTLAALGHMRRQGFGTIVQVGSALAYRSIPLQSAYCAAKAAARAFTDSLRCELIHEGSPIRLTMVHLPAVNTPQFDWARSRLPRSLQPVPPVYDPDVAAEAIVKAALEAPRELWVGVPTAEAILGTMAAPAFLDRMMARRAWEGQMTDRPAAERPDNLFEPVEENRGPRGRFTSLSRRHAVSASEARVRGASITAALALAAGLAVLGRKRSRRA
jgi:NAD(P)-dependent dehydrogenase (short-subunit alcohol dehydrogenase family)